MLLLRHFAIKGLSKSCWLKKWEIIAFSPPPPPCNVMLLFEQPVENNKQTNTLTLNGWERGGVWIDLFSKVWWSCLNNFVADCGYFSTFLIIKTFWVPSYFVAMKHEKTPKRNELLPLNYANCLLCMQVRRFRTRGSRTWTSKSNWSDLLV